MFLDSLRSHSLPHPSPIIYTFPSQLHVFFSFLKSLIPVESSRCYQYVHGCRAIYWSMGSLSDAASLRKTNSLPAAVYRQQLLRLWWEFTSPSPIHIGIQRWLAFVQGLYILTAVGSSCVQLGRHVQKMHVSLETSTSFHSYSLSTSRALGK